MSDWRAAPTMDAGQIADLAAILPRDQVLTLIRGFTRELETRPCALLRLVPGADIAAVRREAHLLRGVALNMGAARIAALAGAVETAEPGAVPMLADDLPGCARDTLTALGRIEAALSATA